MGEMRQLNEAHYHWQGIIQERCATVPVKIPDNVHLMVWRDGSLLMEGLHYTIRHSGIRMIHELQRGDRIQIYATVTEEG